MGNGSRSVSQCHQRTNDSLTNQQALVALRVSEMTAAVQLIEALGGGWDVTQLPTPKQVSTLF